MIFDASGRAVQESPSLGINRVAELHDTLSLASLVGRRKLARRAGKQFGGRRDVYTAAGYVPEGELDFRHYWSLYKRGDIAGKIVDMPAQTTWKDPPILVDPNTDDGVSDFTESFEALATRLRLWNRFERVDRMAGIGRYAVLFLGVRGVGDDLDLREPLDNGSFQDSDDLLYVTALHEEDAQIAAFQTDAGDPRFGLPEFYDLRFASDLPGFTSERTRVHWTRVIHVAEDVLADDVYGRPRLERVINRLFDLEKILAGTGEAYWQLASRILVGEMDPESEISDDMLKNMGEELEEIVHDLRRQFLGSGVELKWLASDPPDPSNAADLYFFIAAASAGIPKRLLFGTETGERASEQDERQWHGTIGERRERFAEPIILRAFIDRLANVGLLEAPLEYEVIWQSLREETPQEIAESNKAVAETAKALTPVGGSPLDLVEIDTEGTVRLRTSEELEEIQRELEEVDDAFDPGPPEATEGEGEQEGMDDEGMDEA